MNPEWVGIAGTVLVLLAFCTNNEKSIRLLDMVGAALFVLYGALIGALSNILLNGALIAIHIVKLYKIREKGTRY